MMSKDTDEFDDWIYSFRMGKDREMDDGLMNVNEGLIVRCNCCGVMSHAWCMVTELHNRYKHYMYCYMKYIYMIYYNMKFLFFGNSYKYLWFVFMIIIRSLYRCSIYTTIANYCYEYEASLCIRQLTQIYSYLWHLYLYTQIIHSI